MEGQIPKLGPPGSGGVLGSQRRALPLSRVRTKRLQLPAAQVPSITFRRWKCSQTRSTEPRERQIQIKSLVSLLPEAGSSSFHVMGLKAGKAVSFLSLINKRSFRQLTLWVKLYSQESASWRSTCENNRAEMQRRSRKKIEKMLPIGNAGEPRM